MEITTNMRKVVLGGVLALAVSILALMASAPAAQAEERVCRGTIGTATVDNLRVPSGATCTLNGTTAKGTVKVESGAKLYANGVRVNGNIQSEGFRVVSVGSGSVVGGNVQLNNGRSGGEARIVSTRINGDLQFDSNAARIVARNNTVGANLQAVQNTGGLVISGNKIAQNLQCKENNPPPTGGSNTAGDKEGQCARL
jgi:opacity protein-like surface antigen